MQELFREAITGPNLLYTILLGFVLLYFLSVLLGALDLEFFEIELDADIDIDVDIDMDVEAEADADVGGGGLFVNVLSFLNIGKVPFMIYVSLVILSMWVIGIIANHIWYPTYSWFPLALMLPNFLLSLLVGKLLSEPFKSSFSKINKQGLSKTKLVGKICQARTTLRSDAIGQAEVMVGEDHHTITAKLQKEKTPIKAGEKGLIIEYHKDDDYFIVAPFDV
ncbi:MAG: hypothetical protein AB8H47_01275 [Bacteroidia bacterium]